MQKILIPKRVDILMSSDYWSDGELVSVYIVVKTLSITLTRELFLEHMEHLRTTLNYGSRPSSTSHTFRVEDIMSPRSRIALLFWKKAWWISTRGKIQDQGIFDRIQWDVVANKNIMFNISPELSNPNCKKKFNEHSEGTVRKQVWCTALDRQQVFRRIIVWIAFVVNKPWAFTSFWRRGCHPIYCVQLDKTKIQKSSKFRSWKLGTVETAICTTLNLSNA